jgi:hypothetical protein
MLARSASDQRGGVSGDERALSFVGGLLVARHFSSSEGGAAASGPDRDQHLRQSNGASDSICVIRG